MERKIGEVFELDGVKLRVKKAVYYCVSCYLYENDIICGLKRINKVIPECTISERKDKQSVIFTEVKE